MIIQIHNKEYNVKEATTEEEKTKGLQGVTELGENEGMLFYMDNEQSQQVFTMKGMKIPIDIIFINLDLEVVYVAENCLSDDENIVSSTENLQEGDYIEYVLEVNANSGIKVGDELEFEEEKEPVMKVLALDGSTLTSLWGGERIFSRVHTKVLIKKAKKADISKDDKDYKALGKYMFKCIKSLDTREPEYVQTPEKKD